MVAARGPDGVARLRDLLTGAVLAHDGAHAGGVQAWIVPLLAVVVPGALYGAGVLRRRRAGRRWGTRSTASAGAGLVLVGIALSPPLEQASGTASGHVVQHLLLGMLAPVALVLAAPTTLLLGALPLPARPRVAAVLRSRPVHVVSHVGVAAVLSVGGLALLYLTPLHALSQRSEVVHHLVHAHLLLAGCLYAWAVAGPDPAPRRPGTGTRLAVLVLAGGAHAYLAKVLYRAGGALPPGSGWQRADVETAAQLMSYGGHLTDLLLVTALLAQEYRRTGRDLARHGRSRPLEAA